MQGRAGLWHRSTLWGPVARRGRGNMAFCPVALPPHALGTPPLRMQEPLAFAGGLFAGALGLDPGQEPLKGWLERTSAAAGVAQPRGDQQEGAGSGSGGMQ